MQTAADRLYAIVRELADPNYQTGEPPNLQDMTDAVVAYEVERKLTSTAGNVPAAGSHRKTRRVMIPNEAWFVVKIGENWPGGRPALDRLEPAVGGMWADLCRFIETENK